MAAIHNMRPANVINSEESKAHKLTGLYTRLQTHNLFLRERMFQITSAAVTILVIDGWTVSTVHMLNWSLRGLILVAIVLVFSAAQYSVYSHYKEYLASASMIVRVERAMGAYKRGEYLESESLYEPASQEWGTGKYSSHLIRTYSITLLLFLVFSFVVVMIFDKGRLQEQSGGYPSIIKSKAPCQIYSVSSVSYQSSATEVGGLPTVIIDLIAGPR
jgi:hypothetical protein